MTALQTLRAASACAFAATVTLAGCASLLPPTASRPEPHGSWVDERQHLNRMIPSTGTAIHVVDYGGAGMPLVFIAGLGNSAHVFDEFGPRFADSNHVIAITRRGFGESGQPDSGYDTDQLTDDIRTILDSLGLQRVVLVGHSLGGDEITEFAARYPERTAATIYLEAAYDRSTIRRRLVMLAATGSLPPALPSPSRDEKSSPSAYRDFLARIYGVSWPLSEVRATRVFDSAGAYVGDVTSAARNLSIFSGEHALRYADVRSPVLAIYATERDPEREFPWVERMHIGKGKAMLQVEKYMRAENAYEEGERNRLAAAIPTARIVTIPHARHYVFLSNPDEVERLMREFLPR